MISSLHSHASRNSNISGLGRRGSHFSQTVVTAQECLAGVALKLHGAALQSKQASLFRVKTEDGHMDSHSVWADHGRSDFVRPKRFDDACSSKSHVVLYLLVTPDVMVSKMSLISTPLLGNTHTHTHTHTLPFIYLWAFPRIVSCSLDHANYLGWCFLESMIAPRWAIVVMRLSLIGLMFMSFSSTAFLYKRISALVPESRALAL
eukprot:5000097-Amphidinium_carterae.1